MSSITTGSSRPPPVFLERMPQQPALLGTEDDWTGLSSPAERRKLQNRINQRTYRKRKLVDAKQSRASSTQNNACNVTVKAASETQSLWQLFYSAMAKKNADRAKLEQVARICRLGSTEAANAISEFERWAQDHSKGSPGVDNILVIVKFNVFRALVSNGISIGLPVRDHLDDDALSPFTNPGYPFIHTKLMPPSLRPTKLQKELVHHPWIDVLPIPRMRDNLLLAGGSYDDMALCMDCVGCYGNTPTRTGIIIWSEPWDPSGWEVTEHFFRNWGWTIKGCNELLVATNFWRQRRGERPLKFEQLDMDTNSNAN